MFSVDPVSKRLLSSGNPSPIVLVYHSISVGSSTPKWKWSVSLDNFKSQIDLLVSLGYLFIHASDLSYPADLAVPSVAITFDDGYKDNLSAANELQERGLTATWFVVQDYLRNSSHIEVNNEKKEMLTNHDTKDLSRLNFEIGSHSKRHPHLTTISDADLLGELSDSKAYLEDLLDAEIASFAYPYGDYDARVVSAVKDAGYSLAMTTDSGAALSGNDPFTIRRLSITAEDSLSSFARKLAFADNDVNWLKTAKYLGNRIKKTVFSQ